MESQNSHFSPHKGNAATTAEALLTDWLQAGASTEAVQMLTPTAKVSLLDAIHHLLASTSDINLDHQDIWGVLAEAATLQFSRTTCSGKDRAKAIGPQLWSHMITLGSAALPANRLLLAVCSGPTGQVEMDELTDIVEYVAEQVGEQAEIVFGHGDNPELKNSIQVLLLIGCR